MIKFWIRVVILLALFIANIVWMGSINKQLKHTCAHKAQQLEYVSDARVARQIVDDWTRHGVRGAVTKGILADLPFIAIYVLLAIVVLRRCANALPAIPNWQPVGAALVRAAVIAGALDLVENLGMLLELYQRWFSLAPFVAFAMAVKYLLLGLIGLYVLLTILLWIRIRAAKHDPKLIAEVTNFV